MAEQVLDRDEWMRRTGPLYPVLVALWTVTRVPRPRGLDPATDDLGRAAPWFPLIGAVLGAAAAVLASLARGIGLVPALAAALVVGALMLATGALLERGATRTAERFRDEDPGEALTFYGILALVAVVGLRGLALIGTSTSVWAEALILSQAIACWTPLLLGQIGDTLEPPSTRRRTLQPGPISLSVFGATTLALLVLAVAVAGLTGLVALLLAAAVTFGLGLLLQRRFGGSSADGLAAIAVSAELVVLLCFAAAEPATASAWVR